MLGVSVVICCHNSAARLGATLEHLLCQTPSKVPWEVIVVDNGSSDDTAAVAWRTWANGGPATLRVVHESKLGLAQARVRGFNEARHDIVSFVDDDNWVCPDWVRLVSEVMSAQPRAGACGGISEASFERTPPAWFAQFNRSYAVGELHSEAADVTWSKGYLWGAGLNIRKQAWQRLQAGGFTPLLSDRLGSNLNSGGDTELCRALRLAGWQLYYEPRLQLKHFMPAGRLNWDYLCRLRRAFGASSVALDAYDLVVRANDSLAKRLIRECWSFQVVCTLRQLLTCGASAWSARQRKLEGDAVALEAEWLLGRLGELRRNFTSYHRTLRSIRSSSWRDAQLSFPAVHSRQ